MQNEHIEHFKRWQSAYLMWAYSNFNRIVSEIVDKHKKEMLEEREKNKPLSLYAQILSGMRDRLYKDWAEQITKDNIFLSGTQWNNVKIGSVLKIRMPGTGTISSSPR